MKPGDVVKLKSGGPLMTVIRPAISWPGSFTCCWATGEQFNTDDFPSETLVLQKPEAPKQIEGVAQKFVDDLFRSGVGKVAVRLELKDADENGMGGWGRPAVLERITVALKSI